MTKQNKNTYYLCITSIAFILIVMIGSFVVSFNVLDLLYTIYFVVFVIVYRINSHKVDE